MATFTKTLDATFTGIEVETVKLSVKTKYNMKTSVSVKWNVKTSVDKKIKPHE